MPCQLLSRHPVEAVSNLRRWRAQKSRLPVRIACRLVISPRGCHFLLRPRKKLEFSYSAICRKRARQPRFCAGRCSSAILMGVMCRVRAKRFRLVCVHPARRESMWRNHPTLAKAGRPRIVDRRSKAQASITQLVEHALVKRGVISSKSDCWLHLLTGHGPMTCNTLQS